MEEMSRMRLRMLNSLEAHECPGLSGLWAWMCTAYSSEP